MDLAKAKEDPLYNRARYWFVMLLRERFHNKDDTLEKFHSLMKKHMEKEIGTNNLISEVNTLFNGHPDLISEFNHFIPRDLPQSTSIEHDRKKHVYLDQGLHNTAIEACLDYTNIAKLVLQDDGKFEAFADVLIRFQEHEDVDLLREEALPLLKEHPGLEIELSNFLAATVETRHNKKGRRNNVFAFYEVRRDEFSPERGGDRVHTEYEEKFFDWEDDMHIRDMKFHAWDSALKAEQKLICLNSEKDPKEIALKYLVTERENMKISLNNLMHVCGDKTCLMEFDATTWALDAANKLISEIALKYSKKKREDMKISLNNLMLGCGDKTCLMEVIATTSALDAANKLILENKGRDPNEKIDMGIYFSTFDVEHLEKLKLHEYLYHDSRKRHGVIRRSKFIASCLELVLEYQKEKLEVRIKKAVGKKEYLEEEKRAKMEKRSTKKKRRLR